MALYWLNLRWYGFARLAFWKNWRTKISYASTWQFEDGYAPRFVSKRQLGVTLFLGLAGLENSRWRLLLSRSFFSIFPVRRSCCVLCRFSQLFCCDVRHGSFGELIPKNVAMQKTGDCSGLYGPCIFFIRWVGPSLPCLTGRHTFIESDGIEPAKIPTWLTGRRIMDVIAFQNSRRGGVLNQMESELIDNVFDFADCMAREIMVPRRDMVCLFVEEPYEDNLRLVMEMSAAYALLSCAERTKTMFSAWYISGI